MPNVRGVLGRITALCGFRLIYVRPPHATVSSSRDWVSCWSAGVVLVHPVAHSERCAERLTRIKWSYWLLALVLWARACLVGYVLGSRAARSVVPARVRPAMGSRGHPCVLCRRIQWSLGLHADWLARLYVRASSMQSIERRPNPSLHPNRYSGLRPLPRSGELKR